MTPVSQGPAATWGKFVTTVGVPSAALLFLLWRLTTGIEIQVDQNAATTARMERALDSHIRANDSTTLTMLTLMRQICVNTAATDEQRRSCVQ
jgi:hypothetical protein